MEQAKVQNLALTAARSRLLALDMVYGAASGHIGGSVWVEKSSEKGTTIAVELRPFQ